MNLMSLARRWGLATIVVAAAFHAHADSPSGGATLFSNDCSGSNCHGTNPLGSNANKIYNGRNARAVIDSAIGNVSQMNSLRASFPAGGSAIADVAAYLGNTPTSLSFASTAVGATSAALTVTVYASTKSSANAIGTLAVTTSGDFARSGGTCTATVAFGTNCTVQVSFTPTATGARTGTLTLSHNRTLTPITIALGGTGSGGATPTPVAGIAPASLSLAATAIGATSAAQNVTVSNSGTAALALTTITLGNPADFVIAGGTCSAGGSVAAGSSCTVSVAFKPAAGAPGPRTGTLVIAHNAAGSPGSIALNATATAAAAPAATLTTSLAFGSVAVGSSGTAQTATLTNSGSAPLLIGTIATGSGEFPIAGGTCTAGASLAAGASCSVNVGFAPASAGARSGSLTVTHNASGGQSAASLSGTGVALTPVASLSPLSLNFTQTVSNTSAVQTVTLSNTGNAPLVIGTLSLAGAQAAEFLIAPSSTCAAGASVAANASCAIGLSFTPGAVGARNASLAVTHNAAGSPTTVSLTGTGTATPQPAISLNAATLAFAAQTVNTASATQTVTVSNSGSSALVFSALTLTGTAAADFARTGSCSPTGTLAAGATCAVTFTFTPTAAGARSATLTIASNASNGAAVLSLSGTGSAVATPGLSLAPAALAFGNQTGGTASAARIATLTNTGSGALTLGSITTAAPFSVSHNCGGSVAAGASCALSVVFSPVGPGAAAGSVLVASNAAGSPASVALSGTGVTTSPVLAWVPASTAVHFADVSLGGTPSTSTLTLTNQGPGAVTLGSLTLSGAQAAAFSVGTASSCVVNVPLAQAASCTVVLAFQPGAVGAAAATLQVASSGTNPPDVALSGSATAPAQPAAGVVPTALSFDVPTGSATIDAQTLTLQSTGSAVLRVSAARVASGSFTLAPAASGGCAAVPFDLMPGQSCALSVAWSGTSPPVGTASGLVEIDTNAAAPQITVTIQAVAQAAAPTAPPATLSNAGGGGCSIARGDSLADPVLWLLILAAALVLWRRRKGD